LLERFNEIQIFFTVLLRELEIFVYKINLWPVDLALLIIISSCYVELTYWPLTRWPQPCHGEWTSTQHWPAGLFLYKNRCRY